MTEKSKVQPAFLVSMLETLGDTSKAARSSGQLVALTAGTSPSYRLGRTARNP